MRIGFLHTAPALAATFEQLLTESEPAAQAMHVVDSWLLSTAIADGVTPAVHAHVHEHVRYLAEHGVNAVLITCSSIGETTEGHGVSVPVLRVDAAMAAEAVRLAGARGSTGRITVLATLDSTLGPTLRLLEEFADGYVALRAEVVSAAAEAKAAGNHAAHDDAIRTAAERAAVGADVIVLAQASMAPAVAQVELGVPVLTSPELGLGAVLAAATPADN